MSKKVKMLFVVSGLLLLALSKRGLIFTMNMVDLYGEKTNAIRVFWWCSGLRIQHCHCCGLGSIPGLGSTTCHRHSQEEQRSN